MYFLKLKTPITIPNPKGIKYAGAEVIIFKLNI
jgi:hypothetical protein